VSGLSPQHVRGLQEKQRRLQSSLTGQSSRRKQAQAHSTKLTGAGLLVSRSDGTALPAIASGHIQNIVRASRHPDVADRHADVFQKLLDGHETLNNEEVRRLRHAARYPGLADSVSRSLMAAADLHEAARLADESGGREETAGDSPLTSGEIQRDIERVVGPYPPRGSRPYPPRGSRPYPPRGSRSRGSRRRSSRR